MTAPSANFTGDSNDPIHVECQFDDDTRPSIAIVRAIAAIENVDPVASPTALGITLYDHVDPDALDRLVTTTASPGEASLSVEMTVKNGNRYEVAIRAPGHLVVERTGCDGS